MFNKTDISAELELAMQKHLVGNAIEKRAEKINKFAKALDYLNSVAEIFDELGLRKEAEYATTLLEVVAKKKTKKKTKSKPKAKKKKQSKKPSLTSEKMVENIKEKGWMFNDADDSEDSECSMCMDADDNFADPQNAYKGHHDHEEPFYESDFDDESVELGREFEKDDPFAPGGAYDKFDDFEDEVDFGKADDEYPTLPSTPAAKKHHTMLPPPDLDNEINEYEDMLAMPAYRPHSKNWHDIEETARPTIRPSKHR